MEAFLEVYESISQSSVLNVAIVTANSRYGLNDILPRVEITETNCDPIAHLLYEISVALSECPYKYSCHALVEFLAHARQELEWTEHVEGTLSSRVIGKKISDITLETLKTEGNLFALVPKGEKDSAHSFAVYPLRTGWGSSDLVLIHKPGFNPFEITTLEHGDRYKKYYPDYTVRSISF